MVRVTLSRVSASPLTSTSQDSKSFRTGRSHSTILEARRSVSSDNSSCGLCYLTFIVGLISAAQVIGSLVGLPFSPIASDNLGRKPTLFIGACFMLAGVALQTSSTSIGMFIGARGISTYRSRLLPLLRLIMEHLSQSASD